MERLAGSASAVRDAELLLMGAAGCDRVALLTQSERVLSSEENARYSGYLERRAAHEPVQYILGEQEFFGLRFELTPDVLIPRPETEHLVEELLALVPHDRAVRIAELGTGSGAIAVALAHRLPLARITAVDISPAALAVARRNAAAHRVEGRIEFLESDLLGAVAGQSFDAVVSNPPYVAESEQLEPQVRDYEPRGALFAGASGLEIFERLIPQAAEGLAPRGWLLLEIGAGQESSLRGLLAEWDDVRFVADLQGIARVAFARRR